MAKNASLKYVLGIQCFANHDAGAALVCFDTQGEVLDYVAISEERLIRKKFPYTFPLHSIAYCMDHFGLSELSQIDLIVGDYIRLKQWFRSSPSYFATEFDYLKLKFDYDPKKIVTISHHMAHAASVYYTSGYADSAILIVDGNGSELQTTSFLHGDGYNIKYLDSHKAHGIGSVYTSVTAWILGFGHGGEGKTMGLAPYGKDHPQVLDINGQFDGVHTDFSGFMRRMPYSDVLNHIPPYERINPLRGGYEKCEDPSELLNPYYSRVAFDVQKEAERVMTHLGQAIEAVSPSKNLCLAGGVALNSVANKIMFDSTDFESMFVFPACSDAGIPFGLAVWGYYNARELGEFPRRTLSFPNAYTGSDYGADRITSALKTYDIPHRETSVQEVAQLIADGNIIGWHQGESEYGPRALGHRSILADSRRAEMTDIVNIEVKHREAFRPFAPAVLADHCAEYFDLADESPFMLLVADVKKPDVVPSVTHVDGTARVQTVTPEANGRFFDLIEAFYEITGVPVIMNTSFNDAGEPIVETPEDSLICFMNTGLDYLVLGDVIVSKQDVDKDKLAKKMEADRREIIDEREQALIERFCPGYDPAEAATFIEATNKMAEWHVRFRSKYETEKQVADWVRDEAKVAIVGTIDHTLALGKHINGFAELQIQGFVPFETPHDRDGAGGDSVPYPMMDWSALEGSDCDAILISSHEFMFDIEKAIEERDIGKPVFKVYDDMSRSILDMLGDLPAFPC